MFPLSVVALSQLPSVLCLGLSSYTQLLNMAHHSQNLTTPLPSCLSILQEKLSTLGTLIPAPWVYPSKLYSQTLRPFWLIGHGLFFIDHFTQLPTVSFFLQIYFYPSLSRSLSPVRFLLYLSLRCIYGHRFDCSAFNRSSSVIVAQKRLYKCY